MPTLCNFRLIQGDTVTIGDGNDTWVKTFNTRFRRGDMPAFLIFNIRGLSYTTENVPVKINNKVVGYIYPYRGERETTRRWYTQMIPMTGSDLRDGNNEIEIRAVGWHGSIPENMYDDFVLKNVVIFFRENT